MKTKGKRIAVIGAGIAGLAAAHELKKAGFTVVVYEKAGVPGGRMATQFKDGFQFNSGATFLSENYHELKSYAAELGIPLTPMEPGSRHRVLRGGKAYHYGARGPLGILRLDVISLTARLRLVGWLGKSLLRLGPGNFFDLSSTRGGLDFGKAGPYLRTRVGNEAVDYLIDPFTAALHFYRSDGMSTAVVFMMLKMMTEKGNFSARHPKGGMAAIPHAMAKGLSVRYNTKIEGISSVSGGCRLRVNGKNELFSAVVLACPAPAALTLLANPTAAQQKMLKQIAYAASIVVALRVPADLFSDATHCIYVPFVENQTVSCCIFEGRKGQELVQDGKTLLNVYLHDGAAQKLLKKSDQAIARIVRNELSKICPEVRARSREIVLHDLVRWPIAMPKFEHRTVSVVSNFVRHHQGGGNIFFAGDYLNAPWTEGAARSGKRVAQLIEERLGA